MNLAFAKFLLFFFFIFICLLMLHKAPRLIETYNIDVTITPRTRAQTSNVYPTPDPQKLFLLSNIDWELEWNSQWELDLTSHIASQTVFLETTFDQNSERMPSPIFGNSQAILANLAKRVHMTAVLHSPEHLNLILRDDKNIRWEIPYDDPYPHPRGTQSFDPAASNFEFLFNADPFQLTVKRRSTQEVIFEVKRNIIFSQDYIEFVAALPTKHFYGMGERIFDFEFTPGEYSLFLSEQYSSKGSENPSQSSHGQHPMYLMREKSNKYHITYLRNMHSQQIKLSHDPLELTWVTIGGILDLNFFLGEEDPESAIRAYHSYLGGWTMPAFWHMGYHMHLKGPNTNEETIREVLTMHTEQHIPIDTIWSDFEYLEGRVNFKIDSKKYPSRLVEKLFHIEEKRWVPALYGYIPTDRTSPAWNYPNVLDLVVKDQNMEYYKAKCWSGECYVIDFNHPNASAFWDQMIRELDSKWKLSGIWLDSNEIADLCLKENVCMARARAGYDKFSKIPYWPGDVNLYSKNVLPPSCLHHDNVDEFTLRPAMGGLFQAKFSFDSMRKKSEMPLVFSKSNSPGTGKYAFHYFADIKSDWTSLRLSMKTLLSYSLFGIPFAGTDMCGTIEGNIIDPELCARWYQLGVFFPFVRSSHVPRLAEGMTNETNQYERVYYDSIVRSIRLRYSLLRYYYSVFIEKSESIKGEDEIYRRIGTVLKPFFFAFYDEEGLPENDHPAHKNQFMLGDRLMIVPIVEKSLKEIEVYFLNYRWYDMRSLREIYSRGRSSFISASMQEDIPHFLKGGNIIFKQNLDRVKRTDDLQNEIDLYIGLGDYYDSKTRAEGFIIDVNSFEEKTIYEKCLVNKCGFKLEVEIEGASIDKTRYLMKMKAGLGGVGDAVSIKKIFMLGFYEQYAWSLREKSGVLRSLVSRCEYSYCEVVVNFDIKQGEEYIFEMN